MNELALFAGAGGGILSGKLLGWRCVCAVEINEYARNVLLARQNDGCLKAFPIWDDVTTFDGRPWTGIVDVISGGFPCQDIAAASHTKTGIAGKRSGLWKHMARIIAEVRSPFVFVENSPRLTSCGLNKVLSDLAALGYNARWGVLGASQLGAPHKRERIWIVAYSDQIMGTARAGIIKQLKKFENVPPVNRTCLKDHQNYWVEMAGQFYRMDDGMANRVERTEALGNGQVPAVAALAWNTLAPI